jgi:hypothetical protein
MRLTLGELTICVLLSFFDVAYVGAVDVFALTSTVDGTHNSEQAVMYRVRGSWKTEEKMVRDVKETATW